MIFYQIEDICLNFVDPDLFMIPQGALPWQAMFDKIGKLTRSFSTLAEHIRISQF